MVDVERLGTLLAAHQPRSRFEALAVFVHALMLESGCTPESLDPKWNASERQFEFRYTNAEGSRIELSCVVLGDNLTIHAVNGSTEAVGDLELDVNKFVRPNAAAFTDPDDIFKTAAVNLPGLVAQAFETVLKRDGTASADPASTSKQATQPRQHYHHQQARVPSQMPRESPPPENPPPVDLNRMRRPANDDHPFNIGRDDLDPLRAGPPHAGGGMIMDPSHPLLAGGQALDPFRHPFNQPGPLGFPPGAVPAGARFDPLAPFAPGGGAAGGFGAHGAPGSGEGFGAGGLGGRRGGAGPGMPFGRHGPAGPDNDHLPPPGYGDMYM